jgi:hypothetical protein
MARRRPNLSTEECAVIARDLGTHPRVKSVVQQFNHEGWPVVIVHVKGEGASSIVNDQDYRDIVARLTDG